LAFVAIAVGILLLTRFGLLPLPVRLVFPLILLLVAAPTVFWWAWVDEWTAALGRRWWSMPARLFVGAYAVATLVPVLMLLARSRAYESLPVPMLMWLMVWHLSVMTAGVAGLAIWLPWVLVRRLRSASQGVGDAARETPRGQSPAEAPMTRRAVLTGALAGVPILLAGGAVGSGLRQQGRFTVRRVELQLARLPERLRGLTVTHISDLHVGRIFRPEHLEPVVEAVNALGSDLIAITGDIVDHSADYMPAACDAFAAMQSRYGRFVVAGNHDLIDSPREAMAYLAARERGYLADQIATLEIGGERLRIAGLFWSRHDRERFGLPGHYDRVEGLLPAPAWASGRGARADHRNRGGDQEPFTLALAHHPHAFDALADAGVDLTLAGHTHGGQVMATSPGADFPVGGGNLLFRYIWGEYLRGDSALFVSSGVGNWFPVRINAPAEIVQIRLV